MDGMGADAEFRDEPVKTSLKGCDVGLPQPSGPQLPAADEKPAAPPRPAHPLVHVMMNNNRLKQLAIKMFFIGIPFPEVVSEISFADELHFRVSYLVPEPESFVAEPPPAS
jgi:hypothetical protein